MSFLFVLDSVNCFSVTCDQHEDMFKFLPSHLNGELQMIRDPMVSISGCPAPGTGGHGWEVLTEGLVND